MGRPLRVVESTVPDGQGPKQVCPLPTLTLKRAQSELSVVSSQALGAGGLRPLVLCIQV